METKQHWLVHVAPIHGALEEAEAVAGSYGIYMNSNRPLWQEKVVLYWYSGATGIFLGFNVTGAAHGDVEI